VKGDISIQEGILLDLMIQEPEEDKNTPPEKFDKSQSRRSEVMMTVP